MIATYLRKSEIYETRPVNVPVIWGTETLANVKRLNLGAFVYKVHRSTGKSKINMGIRLDAATEKIFRN